ncbi:aminotransferase class V-fold PLP-dependent enzyme, partial [Klebsiella pneumoniae]|uniref:aminotransferase class V-fold PLP-dependent enzyme n=1 Tax=Klebsiella pneumoniae TaxID=573 RepID=UPI00396A8F53
MILPCAWRADFPAFSAFAAEGLTYLDSAATAQKPQAVLGALNGYYLGGAANLHRAPPACLCLGTPHSSRT